MPRILFIAAHRPDRSPSQRFRFEQYLPWLEQEGWECELSYLITEAEDRIFYRPGRAFRKGAAVLRHAAIRLRDALQARRYDVVFVQREAFFVGPPMFEALLQAAGPALVYDLDDAVWLPNVSNANQRFARLKRPEKVNRVLARADLVVAGNGFLAEHARRFNPRVHVIPTTIDTELYRPAPKPSARGSGEPAVEATRREEGAARSGSLEASPEPRSGRPGTSSDEPIVIGWSGSTTTIEHFREALPVLHRLKERFGSRVDFRVVGDGSFQVEELGIQGRPWRAETEVADLQEMDIGIMPLPDTDWARGKCGLKGLQYMALEIPAVMADVGANREIVTHGVDGFLCRTEKEWEEALTRLVESLVLREEVGRAGRKRVEEAYSVQVNRERYREVLGEAVDRRRSG